MRTDEDDTATLFVRAPHMFLALDLGQRQHLLARERSEAHHFEQQAADVLEHPAYNPLAFVTGHVRKRVRQVVERHAPAGASDAVRHASERFAPGTHALHWPPLHECRYGLDDPLL